MKCGERRGLNVISAECLWLLVKTQRVMEMMRIELENITGHLQEVGVKRAKIILENLFCEKNTQ